MELFVIIVIILTVAGFILGLVMMFSPKFRGKLLSTQLKSLNYATHESKKDLENITYNMMSSQTKGMSHAIDETKGDIESISNDVANTTKSGIEITARAIKKGFTEDEKIYCKHCGAKIDKDSIFCKSCGKEL